MADVHTFTPRPAEARTESLVAAVVAAALVSGYLYLGQGERDPRLLAGLGAMAAALVLAGYLLRFRFQWVDEIQLSDEGATLVRGGKPRTLPWTQVKSVRHFTRSGEQWVLAANAGHTPMTIRADGLNREEAARLRELIPALHAAAAHAELEQGA
jgi:pimeloyl-ACP methyl ester carboxylesterase